MQSEVVLSYLEEEKTELHRCCGLFLRAFKKYCSNEVRMTKRRVKDTFNGHKAKRAALRFANLLIREFSLTPNSMAIHGWHHAISRNNIYWCKRLLV